MYRYNNDVKTAGLVAIVTVSLFAASLTASDAFAQTGTSKITVHTIDSSGETFGYFTVLSQGIFGLATGYTPSSFTVNNGETYNVGVQNYDDFEFDHWQDTGSTIADRDFAITSDTEYYAVYRNINDPATDPDTSRLIIRTVNSEGEEITGYWTVFYQDGVALQTGFSPERFIANDGETYEVFMGDFAGKSFDHWEDGSTENPRKFSLTSDQTFTAHYNEDNVCTVTVVTENSSGELNAWTVFHSYSEGNLHGEGARLQTGFSPATFEAGCGESYEVVVRDTPDSTFDHWDNGSTEEWRVFSVNSDTTFTAMYSP